MVFDYKLMVYGRGHQQLVPLSFLHLGHSFSLVFAPSSSDFCKSWQSYFLVLISIIKIQLTVQNMYLPTNNGDGESHYQDT